MLRTLITYRNNNEPYNTHAVIPTSWVCSLWDWIDISDHLTFVARSDNVYHDYEVPISWPNAAFCDEHIKLSDLVADSR